MGKPVIMLNSVTLAMKGQRLLRQSGIHSDIERIHNPEGCSYGLKVKQEDVQRAMGILMENRMIISSLREGRD